MKKIIRSIQFMIMGILQLSMMFIEKFYSLYIIGIGIIMIGTFLAALLGTNMWHVFGRVMLNGLLIYLSIRLFEILGNWISNLFGLILNEKEENKKIFEDYEKWFYERYNQYSGEHTEYFEYSENYSQVDSVVQKYEEYLKYLGISPDAKVTSDLIKKAYKIKMKEVHPDRNKDRDTTDETAKINEIREFLEMNLEYYLMKRGM